MKTAVVEKPETAGPVPVPPRVNVQSGFVRMTNGCGLSLFGVITDHDLADLLRPGYFNGVKEALERFDRINFTTSAHTPGPVHGTLIVTDVDHASNGAGVAVKVLTRSDRRT